jgi:hypothetical protein
MVVIWIVTPCSLAGVYLHFGVIYCLHLENIRLHVFIVQKALQRNEELRLCATVRSLLCNVAHTVRQLLHLFTADAYLLMLRSERRCGEIWNCFPCSAFSSRHIEASRMKLVRRNPGSKLKLLGGGGKKMIVEESVKCENHGGLCSNVGCNTGYPD